MRFGQAALLIYGAFLGGRVSTLIWPEGAWQPMLLASLALLAAVVGRADEQKEGR